MSLSSQSFFIKKIDLSTRNTDCTKITLRKQSPSPRTYKRVIRDNGIKPVVPPPKKTTSYEEFVRTVQIRRLESRDRRLKDFQSRKKQAQERKKLENELRRKQFLENRERQLRDEAERLLEYERIRKDNRRYWEEHLRGTSRVEKSLGRRNFSPRNTDMNYDAMKGKNMAMMSTSTISLYGVERRNGYGMDYCDPYKFKIYLPPRQLPKTKREWTNHQPYYGDPPLPNVFRKYSMRKMVNKATFPASYAHSAQPHTFKRIPKKPVILHEATSDFSNYSYDGPTAVSMMKEAAQTKQRRTQKASKKMPSYKIPNSKTHLTKKPSSNRNRKPTPKKSGPNHSIRCHCGQTIASSRTSLSSILSVSDSSSTDYICAKVRLRNKCQPTESLPNKSPKNSASPDRPDPFQRNICKSQSDEELTSSSSDSITTSLCSTVSKSSKTSCFRKTPERQQSQDGIAIDTINTLNFQENNHIIISNHTESFQSQDEEFSDTFLCEEKTYEQMISENNDTIDYQNANLNELAQASMEVYVTSASCLTPKSAINLATSETIGVNAVNDVQYVIIPNDPISLPYDLSQFVYLNPVVTPVYEATGEESGLISCVPTESCLHVRHVACTSKYEENFLPKINGAFFPTIKSFGLNSFPNEIQVIITPNTTTEVFNFTTNLMDESEDATEEIYNMPRITPNCGDPNPNSEIFSGPNNTQNSESFENVEYSIVTVEDEGGAIQEQSIPITTNSLQPIVEQEKEPGPETELEAEGGLETRTKSGVALQPDPERCTQCQENKQGCSKPSNDTSITQSHDLRAQLEGGSKGATPRKAGIADTNILKAITPNLKVPKKEDLIEKLDKEIEENLSDLSTDSSAKIIIRSNCGFAVIYITKGKKKSKKKEIGTATDEGKTPEKTKQKRKEKCAENDESCLKRRYRLRAFRRSYKSEFQSRHSKIQFEDDGSFRDDVREILTPKASQDLVEPRIDFHDQQPKEHDSEEYLPKDHHPKDYLPRDHHPKDHHPKEHHPKCPNKLCQCRKKRRSSQSYRRDGPSTMRSKKVSNVVSSHTSFLSRPHPSKPLTLTPYSLPSNLSPNDRPRGTNVSIVTLYRRTSEKLELHANSPYDSLNEIRKRYPHILTSSSSSSGARKHSLDLLSPDSTSLIKKNVEPIKSSRKSNPSQPKDTRTQTRGNRNPNPPSTSARRHNEGNNRVENSQPSGAHSFQTGKKCSRHPNHACEQDPHRHHWGCPGKRARARYRDLLDQDHHDERLSGGACCFVIPTSLSRVLYRICPRSRKGKKRDPSESDLDEDLEISKSRYRAGATPVPVYHHDHVLALVRSLTVLNHFRKMVDLVTDQVHLEDCNDLNIKYYVSCRVRCMVEELMNVKASCLRRLLDDLQTYEKENDKTNHDEFEEQLLEFVEKIKSNRISHNFKKIVPNISQEVQDTLDEILEEVREVLLDKLDELCNCGTYLEASSTSVVSEIEETSKVPYWIQQAVNSVNLSQADEEDNVELCPVDIILLSSLLAKHLVDEFLG